MKPPRPTHPWPDHPADTAAPLRTPYQRLGTLSRREREVLRWVIRGKRNAEIATHLGRSVNTVHKHVQSILKKLGVRTRTAATHVATEAGFRTAEEKR